MKCLRFYFFLVVFVACVSLSFASTVLIDDKSDDSGMKIIKDDPKWIVKKDTGTENENYYVGIGDTTSKDHDICFNYIGKSTEPNTLTVTDEDNKEVILTKTIVTIQTIDKYQYCFSGKDYNKIRLGTNTLIIEYTQAEYMNNKVSPGKEYNSSLWTNVSGTMTNLPYIFINGQKYGHNITDYPEPTVVEYWMNATTELQKVGEYGVGFQTSKSVMYTQYHTNNFLQDVCSNPAGPTNCTFEIYGNNALIRFVMYNGTVDPVVENISLNNVKNNSEIYFYDKKISKVNSVTLITDHTQNAIWYSNKEFKQLNIEMQFYDESTGKNVSVKAVADIPKYYHGFFDIDTSNPDIIVFRDNSTYNFTWYYSINYANVFINKSVLGYVDAEIVEEYKYGNWKTIKETPFNFIQSYITEDITLDPEISSCGTLATDTDYNLTQNISTTGGCFFMDERSTLDCKNHHIVYRLDQDNASNFYGIQMKDDAKLTNCIVHDGSASTNGSSIGIYPYNAGIRAILINVTSFSWGKSGLNVDCANASLNNLTILMNGSSNIVYGTNAGNSITNNSYFRKLAIHNSLLFQLRGNGNFYNTMILQEANNFVMYTATSNLNFNFTNVQFYSTGTSYAWFTGSGDDKLKFTDSILNASSVAEIRYNSNTNDGQRTTLINTTKADGTEVEVSYSGSAYPIIEQWWYLDFNITDGATQLDGANITVRDVNGVLVYTELFNSSVISVNRAILEKNISGAAGANITILNPFQVNISNVGYTTYENLSVNITFNNKINALLQSDAAEPDNIPDQIENLTNVSMIQTQINITINYTNQATGSANITVDGLNNGTIDYPTIDFQINGTVLGTQYNITVYAFNASGQNNTVTSENSILVTTPVAPLTFDPCAINQTGNTFIATSCNYTKNVTSLSYNISIIPPGVVWLRDNSNWSQNIYVFGSADLYLDETSGVR